MSRRQKVWGAGIYELSPPANCRPRRSPVPDLQWRAVRIYHLSRYEYMNVYEYFGSVGSRVPISGPSLVLMAPAITLHGLALLAPETGLPTDQVEIVPVQPQSIKGEFMAALHRLQRHCGLRYSKGEREDLWAMVRYHQLLKTIGRPR